MLNVITGETPREEAVTTVSVMVDILRLDEDGLLAAPSSEVSL